MGSEFGEFTWLLFVSDVTDNVTACFSTCIEEKHLYISQMEEWFTF